MAHSVAYHPDVVESDLPSLNRPTRRRVFRAVELKIAVSPLTFGKPLRSRLAHFRSLRAGDYRIVYAVGGQDVFILAVGHRSRIYDIALKRS